MASSGLVGRPASGYNFRVSTVASKITVKVLFFGRLRELTGLDEESVEQPASATLSDVFDVYSARYPQLAAFRPSLVASRNQEFATWDTRLSPGDEIAILPPVSGG